MPTKPVIVYIESDRSEVFDDNPARDALAYFLKEQCSCEVKLFVNSYDFDDNLSSVVKLFNAKTLILVIVKEEEHLPEQHQQVITKVREYISASLPIVVIPEFSPEKDVDGVEDERVFAFDYYDAGLVQLVKRLTKDFKPPINYYGAETKQEQSMLLYQLETVYRKHYLGDKEEGMMAVPDHNGQVVAEALRLRLLPPELIKEEFDDALEGKPANFSSFEPSAYEQEVDLIRQMSPQERHSFLRCLYLEMGRDLRTDGSVRVFRMSFGNNVDGFAIDTLTLEYLITTGYAEHTLAKERLAIRLFAIEGLKQSKDYWELPIEEEWECRRRIIKGLIISEVKNFSIPILLLYSKDTDKNALNKVARFLCHQRKFIAVNPEGVLIEG